MAQTEQVSVHTQSEMQVEKARGATAQAQQQQSSVISVAGPSLVDARNIGKIPNFNGEHKDWADWCVQFTACMGSANPVATRAFKRASSVESALSLEDIALKTRPMFF